MFSIEQELFCKFDVIEISHLLFVQKLAIFLCIILYFYILYFIFIYSYFIYIFVLYIGKSRLCLVNCVFFAFIVAAQILLSIPSNYVASSQSVIVLHVRLAFENLHISSHELLYLFILVHGTVAQVLVGLTIDRFCGLAHTPF